MHALTNRRSPISSAALALILASAVAGGCTRNADTASGDSGRVAVHAPITDSLTGPGAREGVWQGTDARSTWRAMLDGPRVTQIDEVALYADSTRAMRQFHFDSTGSLASVREERSQKVYGNKATPDTINTIIELEWQVDSLARSAKRVNGVDRLLQPYEVDNIRAHAAELLRIARAGSPASSPGK